MSQIALTYSGVTKSYVKRRVVIDDVSFEVVKGELLVLLGPSGSGKTTILRTIAGIEKIEKGQIFIGETKVCHDNFALPPEERKVSMVFQDYALWPHMTALENVAFALRRGSDQKKDRSPKALVMLTKVGLSPKANRYPSELSGGEQQRVALARALVGDSALVLFDEPLSNLDVDLRERLRVEIASLVRESGATAVYITHDQGEAFALADRIGVLCEGKLVQIGSPEDIYLRPATPFVARFTGVSGEIAGIVRSRLGGDLVEVMIDGSNGAIIATAMDSADAGDRVTVLVRPGSIKVVEDHGDGSIGGTVVDVAYRGKSYDHALLHGTFHLHGVSSHRRYERGTSVIVTIDPAGALAYMSEKGTGGHEPPVSHLAFTSEVSEEVNG